MTAVPPKPKGLEPELWAFMANAYGLGGHRTAGDMRVALLNAVREGDLLPDLKLPDERALYRHVARLKAFYESERVGLKDIPLEHSAFVLEVLLAVLEETEGRVSQFSRAEVDWLVRIHAATPAPQGKPQMSPWQAYQYALNYWTLEQAGEPTVGLDLMLACRTWQGREAQERFDRALFSKWLPVANYPSFYRGRLEVTNEPQG